MNFSQNQLLNVDVSNNLLLEELLGYQNYNMQNFDVSNNDSLQVLIIFNLGLSTIDLSNNLKLIELDVRSNLGQA
ncbi:hypothetical protein N9Y89_00120 [bacterium]|nr:hypothetical protein [bacterium]